MEDTKKENKLYKIIKEWLPYIILLVLVLLFKKYLYAPLYVHGESMMDTLHDGDIMILDIIGYHNKGLERFDIVVINDGKDYIIKRVIGLPGEKIEYIDNKLYVNGKVTDDLYANGKTEDFIVDVPRGKYFVLGDNRENSLDSRYFGPFDNKHILGKTKLIVFPFERYGIKD